MVLFPYCKENMNLSEVISHKDLLYLDILKGEFLLSWPFYTASKLEEADLVSLSIVVVILRDS
ncbi:MAG: hypothetical protein DRN90_03240 [Thermoproteota archaeon]|nr:MAG: hypothetical protein DRN90_03240 [Candidatus Korarchaeota archaeon]